MKCLTKTLGFTLVFCGLCFVCFVQAVESAIYTLYEHSPLRRQVMYTPERDEIYSVKIDKENNNQGENKGKKEVCIFCKLAQDDPKNDSKNLLITRFEYHNLFMNLYPYHKGHMLLIPKRHIKDLSELTQEEKVEMIEILSESANIVKEVLGADGVNIGINIGKIAGSSKPAHIHVHILPRYEKEHVGFIQSVSETLVIQYDMQVLYKNLKQGFDALKTWLCL